MSKKSTEPIDLEDEFVITDADTLKVLAHPQRLEILRNFDKARTVKEVAARIGADPTKLYYHVRMMEKANIIRVTETNIVSGIIEKTYRVTARSYRVADDLVNAQSFDSDAVDEMARSLFDNTRAMLRRSVDAGLFDIKQEGPRKSPALSTFYPQLTSEQVAEFHQRLEALTDDLVRWSEDNEISDEAVAQYVFTYAFFRSIEKVE